MNRKIIVLLSAAIGGISPNLLRLAVSLMRENPQLPEATYLLGLLIFALMGAVVAFIWEETDFKKAFYLGLGLPALIQMSAGEISAPARAVLFQQQAAGKTALSTPSFGFSFSPVALAVEQDGDRKIKLTMNRPWKQCQVVFNSPDTTAEITLRFEPENLSKVIEVPRFANTFQVRIGNAFSNRQNIPEHLSAILHYMVIIGKERWSGLLEAFGIRNAPLWQVEIRKVDQE